jgi:hypothetical protein
MWWRFGSVVVGGLFLFSGALGLLFTLLVSIHDIPTATEWMTYALVALLAFFIALALFKRRGVRHA